MNFGKTKRCVAFLLCFSLVVALFSGCVMAPILAGGAIGGAFTVYVQGDLKTKESASFDRVWLSVVETVEDQEYQIVEKVSAGGEAIIRADLPNGKELTVKVSADRPEVTDISIRVGFWGDREESRRLLRMIVEKLSATASP